jgi:hypothetical protein
MSSQADSRTSIPHSAKCSPCAPGYLSHRTFAHCPSFVFLLKPFKNGLTLHQAQVYVPSQNRKRCDTLLSEVDAVLKDRLATIDDIPTLPNTRQVVTESMRLYPCLGHRPQCHERLRYRSLYNCHGRLTVTQSARSATRRALVRAPEMISSRARASRSRLYRRLHCVRRLECRWCARRADHRPIPEPLCQLEHLAVRLTNSRHRGCAAQHR